MTTASPASGETEEDGGLGFLAKVMPAAFCAGLRVERPTQDKATTEFDDDASFLPSLSEQLEEHEPRVAQRDIDVARLVEDDVSMELLEAPAQGRGVLRHLGESVRGAFESAHGYVLETVDARHQDDLPKYPIARYMVLGAEDSDERYGQRQSYEDALALSAFVSDFIRMLQAGFRVVKHVQRKPARLHTIVLSSDCAILSWTPTKPRPGERKILTKRRVGDASVLADPGPVAKAVARGTNCFALTFAPLSERQAGLAPREIHVFEPANRRTKHVLVDGFALLVERAVHKFFVSQEFRVARANKLRGGARTTTTKAATPSS